jgi:hypothetical protein
MAVLTVGGGTRASVTYSTSSQPPPAGTTFVFDFGCPRTQDNYACATLDVAGTDSNYALPFFSQIGGSTQQPEFCGCPKSGHPLVVDFTVARRISSIVRGSGAAVAVLDEAGNPVPAEGPLWTPGANYSDGFGGSTVPAAVGASLTATAVPAFVIQMTNDAQTKSDAGLYAEAVRLLVRAGGYATDALGKLPKRTAFTASQDKKLAEGIELPVSYKGEDTKVVGRVKYYEDADRTFTRDVVDPVTHKILDADGELKDTRTVKDGSKVLKKGRDMYVKDHDRGGTRPRPPLHRAAQPGAGGRRPARRLGPARRPDGARDPLARPEDDGPAG